MEKDKKDNIDIKEEKEKKEKIEKSEKTNKSEKIEKNEKLDKADKKEDKEDIEVVEEKGKKKKKTKKTKKSKKEKIDNEEIKEKPKKKRKKKLVFKPVAKFISIVISVIASTVFLISVVLLDILPFKYLFALIGIYVVIYILTLVLYKLKGFKTSMCVLVFLTLFFILNVFGSYYFLRTYKFFNDSLGGEEVPKEEVFKPINIFISGIDFAEFRDFNMIVTVNYEKHKILLTSIPRDYYIPVHVKDYKDKLSYMRGDVGIIKDSVADYFEVDMKYYLDINTNSLITLVDTIGGIEYCSDVSFTTSHALVVDTYDDTQGKKLKVKQGCQHLNGIETLTVSRERLAFPGGDVQRQKNCQQIMIQIAKQLMSVNTLTNYNNVLNAVGSTYSTTVPSAVVTSVIKDQLNSVSEWEFESQNVEGSGGNDLVGGSTTTKDWVMIPDVESVNVAKEKINSYLN